MASERERGTGGRAWAAGRGGSESKSQLCFYSPSYFGQASVSPLENRVDNTTLTSQSLWVQEIKIEFELD